MLIAAENEKNFFQCMINNLPYLILLVNSKGEIVYANPRMEDFLGSSLSKLKDRRAGDIFYCVHRKDHAGGCGQGEHCQYSCGFNLSIREALEHQKDLFQKDVSLESGEKHLYFDIKSIPFKAEDDSFVILCLDDQTDKYHHELLKREHAKLLGAIETGAGACHAINQPLAAIVAYYKTYIEKIDKDNPDYEVLKMVDEQIDRIVKISKKLGSITNYRTQKYTDDLRILDLEDRSGAS